MSATTLTITMTDSTVITLSIPAILQTLDAAGTASAPDSIIRSFFRAGVFFDSLNKKAYSTGQIKNIAWT